MGLSCKPMTLSRPLILGELFNAQAMENQFASGGYRHRDWFIISSMNDTPSAEDVTRICTPAGSAYTYAVTSMVYKGWVYTDGNGGHHFGWPDWRSEWFNADFAKPWKPCFIPSPT
jgi:hypothetical protein